MSYFKPDCYKKNIFEVDYKKLKSIGIKCLVFDLDNTLGLVSNKNCPDEAVKLIKKLKKDFIVEICSNNTTGRLKPYLDELEIDGVSWSFKPSIKGVYKIRKKYNLNKKEMCIIGDQIVTDIFTGKRYGIYTVLVDPLGVKDLKITSLNRVIENFILKRYKKKNIFERGSYYG